MLCFSGGPEGQTFGSKQENFSQFDWRKTRQTNQIKNDASRCGTKALSFKTKRRLCVEEWSIVRHQTWLLLLLLFPNVSTAAWKTSLHYRTGTQLHKYMIQIVCDDKNSTINNNTNIDGRFLEIGDPKKPPHIFQSGFKICFLFLSRTIILTKKHKD